MMQSKNILPLLPTFDFDSLSTKSNNDMLDLDFSKLSLSENPNETDTTEKDEFFNHPFLKHDLTIQFIKKSKVMYIMRGLPGSGKSSLTKAICKIYGDKTVVCSGDFYFIDKKTGEYKFDASKLQVAHESAQELARSSCRDSQSPVIIDNTNVSFWEIKPYVQIADNYEYIVIICEPHTPWKFDVDMLFVKNSHNVPEEVIRRKVKDFQPIIPLYFGWFLNEDETKLITTKAFDIFNLCLKKIDNFKKDLMGLVKNGFSAHNIFKPKSNKLHCTTKFCGKSSNQDRTKKYLENSAVSLNNGKNFRLLINAFTITHQTIGAQIVIKNDQEMLELWDNDLDEDQINELSNDALPKRLKKVALNLEPSSRAHITIGLAQGVSAVQTGYDLLSILSSLKSDDSFAKKNLTDTEEYELIYLENARCYIKLKEPISVDSIFSLGFF